MGASHFIDTTQPNFAAPLLQELDLIVSCVDNVNGFRFEDIPRTCNKNRKQQVTAGAERLDFGWVKTDLYLLDFNLVRNITMDAAGVEMAVDAHKANDPYYPRPCCTSLAGAQAWNGFVKGYLGEAKKILDSEEDVERLAVRFLARVIEEYGMGE